MKKQTRSEIMKASWAKRKAKTAQKHMEANAEFARRLHEEQSGITSLMRGDPVSHPSHYNFGKYEVIDVLDDWFPTNPLLWQVGKYIARADHKGNAIEDLRKAKFYLEREINQRSDK